MKTKICVAGNMIVDMLYSVRGLPGPGELTTIDDPILKSTGGAVCNVLGDLALIDRTLSLAALGRVGSDPEGDFVLDSFSPYKNVDLSMVKREGKTSFTAVMADQISMERTFFHYRGANAAFCEQDINLEKIAGSFLHIGYILLLDALDREDSDYGTKMARLLFHAKEHGIKTSVDVVSEAGDRFRRLVPPALRYTDYCIINEVEAAQITGIPLRNGGGQLITANLPQALQTIRNLGAAGWVIVHYPEGGCGLDCRGLFVQSQAIKLPPEAIKGKVGAGDAFCAGVLYMASQNGSLEEGLELGNAAAAASLLQPGAVEGMKCADELKKLRPVYG